MGRGSTCWPQAITQPAGERHLAGGAGHARADDQVGAGQRTQAQRRKLFRRIGPIRVQKADQLSLGTFETRLQRGPVALVAAMPDKLYTHNTRSCLRGLVA